MTAYFPDGVDMRQADPTFQPYEAYLPTVPNPLDVESPKTENAAAEKVCTYLYQAAGDRGTADIQWHAAQVAIHPWSIEQAAFTRMAEELPTDFPWFTSEFSYEVWFSDVVHSLTRKEETQ